MQENVEPPTEGSLSPKTLEKEPPLGDDSPPAGPPPPQPEKDAPNVLAPTDNASHTTADATAVSQPQPVPPSTKKVRFCETAEEMILSPLPVGAAQVTSTSPRRADEEDSALPVTERLYKDALETAAKKSRLAAEKAEADDPEMTFSPQISQAAKTLGKFANFEEFLQYNAERLKKSKMTFKRKVEQLALERDEPCTQKFQVGAETAKIVERLKQEHRYANPVKSWKENLARYLQARTQPTQSTAPEENAPAKNRPFISPHASHQSHQYRTTDDSDVFEKLYKDHEMRRAAHKIIVEAEHEAAAASMFKPNCPKTTGPTTNETSGVDGVEEILQQYVGSLPAARRSTIEIANGLLQKGEEYKQRREELKQSIQKDLSPTFTPTTNKRSRKILEQCSKKYGFNAVATAAAAAAPKNGKGKGALSSPKDVTWSSEIKGVPPPPRAKFDVELFCSRLERKEAQKTQRLEAARRSKEVQELESCTFRPAITRSSVEMSEKWGSSTHYSGMEEPTVPSILQSERYHAADLKKNVRQASRPQDALHRPTEEAWDNFPQRRANAERSPQETSPHVLLDDETGGSEYLANLEQELRDVIADWQAIEPA